VRVSTHVNLSGSTFAYRDAMTEPRPETT
jgi:hypothetical protein